MAKNAELFTIRNTEREQRLVSDIQKANLKTGAEKSALLQEIKDELALEKATANNDVAFLDKMAKKYPVVSDLVSDKDSRTFARIGYVERDFPTDGLSLELDILYVTGSSLSAFFNAFEDDGSAVDFSGYAGWGLMEVKNTYNATTALDSLTVSGGSIVVSGSNVLVNKTPISVNAGTYYYTLDVSGTSGSKNLAHGRFIVTNE